MFENIEVIFKEIFKNGKISGNYPEVQIKKDLAGGYSFLCKETTVQLFAPCRHLYSQACKGCIGTSDNMAYLWKTCGKCICGSNVEFGYFLIIYMLDLAGLLPDDFAMLCCFCYNKQQDKIGEIIGERER